jgi:ubiquinone biosynthesis protein
MRPAQILRLAHINFVLVRHGLDEIILATHLFRFFRFLYYLAPWNWVPRRREPRAVRIRKALEDLGPIYVKFGQILSTRRDLLPDDIAEELARLQDRVPPFPGARAKAMIEAAEGQSVDEVFLSFEETPLASASIAQVHAARLHRGGGQGTAPQRPPAHQTRCKPAAHGGRHGRALLEGKPASAALRGHRRIRENPL